MIEKKKRKAIYNPEAEKRWKAKMTPEQKEERNRRNKFTIAKNFIAKGLYTPEELAELKALIEAATHD
ncbi:hypothetical protein [Lactococcus ileimucosae]|uniref:hypothetical protein n=1 Tax=Lactococcus ileimucosae TaxID=2941329 RepID=UPI0035111FCC